MENSTLTDLDLKRIAFAVSPEERSLGLSLDNDLHPLYRLSNFKASALTSETTGEEENQPFLEERVYKRMIPAFRLASLLLEFSLPFLTKVFCANLVFKGEVYALDPEYKCTEMDVRRVKALLLEWAGRTRFYCKTPFDHASPCEATTEVRTNGKQLPTPVRSLTNISIRTIEFFSQENYDEIDAEVKTAQLAQLAFVLVHEQCHAAFHHRWAEDSSLSESHRAFIARVSPVEPLYHVHMDPRYHELGFAMQAWIHGGSVLKRGKDLIFIEYPGDVFFEATTAESYPFRDHLFSAEFWRAVQNDTRSPTGWDADVLPFGWLGMAMKKHMS
ncbi:hypothetical protein Daus18300_014418 [Diaporthe australafricana]|uniref:Uncharacterized protein n=1 Tax=Diaporthe australafricana TaxID=127596 RepID=A0ABR3VVA4_9PEZI